MARLKSGRPCWERKARPFLDPDFEIDAHSIIVLRRAAPSRRQGCPARRMDQDLRAPAFRSDIQESLDFRNFLTEVGHF
jgi:hypothetical protein